MRRCAACCSVWYSVAACCSVWYSVAECCRVGRRVAACCRVPSFKCGITPFSTDQAKKAKETWPDAQCVAVCCSVLQCVAVCCKVLSFKCVDPHASTGQAKRQRKCLHGGYGVRSRDSMKHNEQHVDTLPWVSFILWIQARETVTKSSTQCATHRYAGCSLAGGYRCGKPSLKAAHTATHTATHNTHTPCGQFIWWVPAREAVQDKPDWPIYPENGAHKEERKKEGDVTKRYIIIKPHESGGDTGTVCVCV